MKKKIIIIMALILIVGLLAIILYHFITNNKNVSISSNEKYIATIYYNYELGIDASRGYDVFVYKDYNGHKFEIKYGEITTDGPTIMKTKGYGKLFTPKDIEDLNKTFEKKKAQYENFSIKYRIMSKENIFEYCELDKFNDFLFK